MVDFFSDILSQDDIVAQEIQIDEEAEYRKYALSLYERIRACETKKNDAAVNDAIISDVNANRVEFITATTDEDENEEPQFNVEEVKIIETVVYETQQYHVPVPAIQHVSKRLDVIRIYHRKLLAKVHDIDEFYHGFEDEIKRHLDRVKNIMFRGRLEGESAELRQLTLEAQVIEHELKVKVKDFANQCTKMQTSIDVPTEGIWISDGTKDLSAGHKPRVSMKLKRRFRFDAKTISLISQMYLSRKPDVKATSKIELNAKCTPEIFKSVYQETETVLAIAFAEAGLTGIEAASIIFPKRREKQEHYCIHCDTAVAISAVIYHSLCPAITWLIRHQPYAYNKNEQALYPIRRTYKSPEKRLKISQLLEFHHRLNNDIIVQLGKETTILKRGARGKLEKLVLNVVKEEDQIGSHLWKVEHGFSPKRN